MTVTPADLDRPPRPWADVSLLGHFALRLPHGHVYLAPTTQKVLVLLAIHGQGLARSSAAALLWPHLPDRRSAASLRSALWRLSRAGGSCQVVVSDSEHLRLDRNVRVDLHTARDIVRDLTTDRCAVQPPAVPGHLRQDLLPDWSESWLLVAREHFRQTRLHALETCSRRLRASGHMDAAMEFAMAALEADPLRESAHRCVSEIHLAEGNIADALRFYDTYRRQLRDELGLVPTSGYRNLLAPFLRRPLDTARGPGRGA
ncbi:transcriptional regulator [Streptomyces sp. NWU49]|uniref:AfsR/SARP family transcriptional regulator n=1 Tax=Streptomyces TaxID=1883 RepID=UPI0002FB21DD|nr:MULTISPECIES: BTAD domain-containing putative transcriptional regulator [Streptomyces]PWJ05447.1 transcriptional regulator [Streptomyces sp. NWU49]